MNELLAPLYWLFKTDPAPGAAEHAEPDAFWAFTDLLGELRDHFCQQLVGLGVLECMGTAHAVHAGWQALC